MPGFVERDRDRRGRMAGLGAALIVLAYYVSVPYPIVLVIGGLGLGFVPGFPRLDLDPDIVLIIFLPPLLYGAAFFSSLRDLRANLRPISSLAIGLVIATMLMVGVVAHAVIDDLSWAAAFTLGAPYVLLPGGAASRSPTSACTITTPREIAGNDSRKCRITGTDTL